MNSLISWFVENGQLCLFWTFIIIGGVYAVVTFLLDWFCAVSGSVDHEESPGGYGLIALAFGLVGVILTKREWGFINSINGSLLVTLALVAVYYICFVKKPINLKNKNILIVPSVK
jgi:hypothetical protein